MSEKGEKLYEHIGNISDELIAEADIDSIEKEKIKNYIEEDNLGYIDKPDEEATEKLEITLTDVKTSYRWLRAAAIILVAVCTMTAVYFASNGQISIRSIFEKISEKIFNSNDKQETDNQEYEVLPTLPPESFDTDSNQSDSILPVMNGEKLSEDKASYKVDEIALKEKYMVKLATHTKWSIDIDADNKKDVFEYQYNKVANKIDIVINDITYLIGNNDKYTFTGELCIIDLNKDDKTYEFAVNFEDADKDRGTLIFTYDGKNFDLLKELVNYTDFYEYNVGGKAGRLKAYKKLNGLRKTYGVKYYIYKNVEVGFRNIVEEDENQNVYDIADGDSLVELKKKLLVYSRMTLTAKEKFIEPQMIVFRRFHDGGGNLFWYYVEAQDGTSGWILVNNRAQTDDVADIYEGPYLETAHDVDVYEYLEERHQYISDNGWAYEYFDDYSIEY